MAQLFYATSLPFLSNACAKTTAVSDSEDERLGKEGISACFPSFLQHPGENTQKYVGMIKGMRQ